MNPIAQLAIVQIGVPLVLIVLNAIVPAASWWALGMRALLLGLGLAWLVLGGLWLYPPWWTPFVMVVFALLSLIPPILRLSRGGASRRPWRRWSETAIVAVTAVAVLVVLVVPAAAARTLPRGPVVDLAEPLDPGTYYVASGGSTIALNRHLATRDSDTWRGQSRGVDLVKVDSLGRRAHGIAPENPEDYFIFGEPVIAPCVGSVVATRDDLVDQRVPQVDRENPAGNYVLLQCGASQVLLAHLRQRSVVVKQGDRVELGTPLGRVGNTGNSSEPHLHLHAQRPSTDSAEPFAGEPEWITIEGHFPIRNRLMRL